MYLPLIAEAKDRFGLEVRCSLNPCRKTFRNLVEYDIKNRFVDTGRKLSCEVERRPTGCNRIVSHGCMEGLLDKRLSEGTRLFGSPQELDQ